MKEEDSQILRGGHNGELDSSLVSKRLVAPLPHRSNLLDSSDTVVGDEDLKMSEKKSRRVRRVELESTDGERERGKEGRRRDGLTFVITE